jgi:1-acyl-sn-glycerol-3-phosphate acyltransferase
VRLAPADAAQRQDLGRPVVTPLRAVWRLLRVVAHGLHGLAIVVLRFPALDAAARHERIQWWARGVFHRMGIALNMQGSWRPGAKLVVANHVSWLDIMAVHASCPQARFVSKAEVRHWPLLGRLVDSADTLYIERERKRDAMRVVHEVAQVLQSGGTVAVFPEGTTGDGERLLPFHANLLQAAIATGTPVQPVVLRYADAQHACSPAARFVGDTTLAQSLWALARARGMGLHVSILSAQATAHADRRALAAHLRECIAQALEDGLGKDPR